MAGIEPLPCGLLVKVRLILLEIVFVFCINKGKIECFLLILGEKIKCQLSQQLLRNSKCSFRYRNTSLFNSYYFFLIGCLLVGKLRR